MFAGKGGAAGGKMSGVHLVVLQHGLWGQPGDLGFLENLISSYTPTKQQHQNSGNTGVSGDTVRVLNSNVNSQRLTYDGIDKCADRLLDLAKSEITKLKTGSTSVTKLSFIGYSLGQSRGCFGSHGVIYISFSVCGLCRFM